MNRGRGRGRTRRTGSAGRFRAHQQLDERDLSELARHRRRRRRRCHRCHSARLDFSSRENASAPVHYLPTYLPTYQPTYYLPTYLLARTAYASLLACPPISVYQPACLPSAAKGAFTEFLAARLCSFSRRGHRLHSPGYRDARIS